MEQILDIITALLEQAEEILGEDLLLAAGAGLILLLLLILLVSRRRNRHIRGDGSGDFLEVGPEPVIVYRRNLEQEETEAPPAPEEPQLTDSLPGTGEDALPPENDEETETENLVNIEELVEPMGPIISPDCEISVQEPAMEPEPLPEPIEDPEPLPEPIVDPEPMPDNELDADEPEPEINLPLQPLPYLESKLANNSLKLFSEQGFHIEKIVYQGIYGGDFIAVRPGARAYVQVKDWKKKLTDNTVAEVNSYAKNHNCNQSIIITSARIKRSAVKAASRLDVSLWNKRTLKKLKNKPIFPREESAATKDTN